MRDSIRAITLATIVTAALVAQPALAAQGHDHAAAAHGTLQLDNGKKWQTDAPLRKGMGDIRQRTRSLPKTSAEGQALAKAIEGDIGYMVRNCKLSPRADATLHVILSQVTEGAHLLASANAAEREHGLHGIHDALATYGKHFDHPGWVNAK
jgi:hypothetical protein